MSNKTKVYDLLAENLCEDLNRVLKNIPITLKETVEEIRIRNGKPLTIYSRGKDYFVCKDGKLRDEPYKPFIVNDDHIKDTFQLISNYSIYAYTEEIRNGYITIRGGHRIGIGGKVIYGGKGIETIKNISSLNIRIAREKIGISNHIIDYLIEDPESFYNTLIVSAPQCGKTTLLRDIIRNLSNGDFSQGKRGFKISLIDERSEIAGMYQGMAQNDIGLRTDVLDGCLKSDGIIMAIRSMSPDIIGVDEIGSIRDIEAIHEALRAGIKLIATIHGSSLDEIMVKPSMKQLFDEKIFQRLILLDRSRGVGTIKEIVDGLSFKRIYS